MILTGPNGFHRYWNGFAVPGERKITFWHRYLWISLTFTFGTKLALGYKQLCIATDMDRRAKNKVPSWFRSKILRGWWTYAIPCRKHLNITRCSSELSDCLKKPILPARAAAIHTHLGRRKEREREREIEREKDIYIPARAAAKHTHSHIGRKKGERERGREREREIDR